MEYLTVDFTQSPARAMRLGYAKGTLVVSDLAQAPEHTHNPWPWLKRWHKEQPRFFVLRPLLALWECPEMKTAIHLPTAGEPRNDGRSSPSTDQGTATTEDTPALYKFRCPLKAKSRSKQDLELEVEVPYASLSSVFKSLSEIGFSCEKISALPLCLWSAFLFSYPDATEKTAAVVWGTAGGMVVIVVDRGHLTFYRHFDFDPANTAPPALYIKESLEQFAFLFPHSAIDCVLLGGNLPESEKLKNWTEELCRCPCEIIAPLRSKRVCLSGKNRLMIDDALLAPYWPCIGLFHGQSRRWT